MGTCYFLVNFSKKRKLGIGKMGESDIAGLLLRLLRMKLWNAEDDIRLSDEYEEDKFVDFEDER